VRSSKRETESSRRAATIPILQLLSSSTLKHRLERPLPNCAEERAPILQWSLQIPPIGHPHIAAAPTAQLHQRMRVTTVSRFSRSQRQVELIAEQCYCSNSDRLYLHPSMKEVQSLLQQLLTDSESPQLPGSFWKLKLTQPSI